MRTENRKNLRHLYSNSKQQLFSWNIRAHPSRNRLKFSDIPYVQLNFLQSGFIGTAVQWQLALNIGLYI